MNYIGSKYSLLSDIETVLNDFGVPANGIALDLFAGTGVVAQLLKARGHVVYANDWQCYAYLTNVAYLEHNALPGFDALLADGVWQSQIHTHGNEPEIATYSITGQRVLTEPAPATRVLRYLNQMPGCHGAFFEAYCQGGQAGRLYFSRENGLRIQAMRDHIETWHIDHLISAREKAWLIACLIKAADRVANTASVYGAYLKHLKKTAQKSLALPALEPTTSAHENHRVFCEDGNALLSRFAPGELRLTYVDPPYNHRQYNANYHILETIARWDLAQFEPRGVTGLRHAAENHSDFCVRRRVEGAFRTLFERVTSEYLLISYNNEGLLSKEKLLALFDEFCTDVQAVEIKYNRFRADVDRANRVYKADHTHEYLIIGRSRG